MHFSKKYVDLSSAQAVRMIRSLLRAVSATLYSAIFSARLMVPRSAWIFCCSNVIE